MILPVVIALMCLVAATSQSAVYLPDGEFSGLVHPFSHVIASRDTEVDTDVDSKEKAKEQLTAVNNVIKGVLEKLDDPDADVHLEKRSPGRVCVSYNSHNVCVSWQ